MSVSVCVSVLSWGQDTGGGNIMVQKKGLNPFLLVSIFHWIRKEKCIFTKKKPWAVGEIIEQF